MPLFRKIECKEGWGGIWKMTETFDELCGMLPHGEQHRNRALHYASERRRLEYMAVRVLIYTLTGEHLHIDYLSSGRPFFQDKKLQLSISHTAGYAAVLFSATYETGIDIEVFSERVLQLKERLIGSAEKAESTYEILLHWSAKETAFKILDEEGIDFRAHLTVEDMDCRTSTDSPVSKGVFSLCYHLADGKQGIFSIHYETASDFVLTYTFRKL